MDLLTSGRYVVAILLMATALAVLPSHTFAQKKDKDKRARADSSIYGYHSPHKATLWALLPGAGQIYNKKYWKLPIVYAGFAVTGYFVAVNRSEYIKYRDAYICSVNQKPASEYETPSIYFICDDPLSERYSSQDLQTIRDFYRRNLELSFIFMGLWYILQIVDATVDAHLYHWNVDEDLEVRVEPVIQPPLRSIPLPNQAPAFNGIRVSFNF